MNTEYNHLKETQNSHGYKILQSLWAQQGGKILDASLKAAAKNQESAWRYFAGQMKGFDLAITQLERALVQMEKDGEMEATPNTTDIEALLKEIKGEPK